MANRTRLVSPVLRACAGTLAVVAVLVLAAAPAIAAAGSLDPTFSGNGKVTTGFGAESAAAAVSMQAGGKIVVAGTAGNLFALARYDADGTPDGTFDGDGRVTTIFAAGSSAATAVDVTDAGKIVVAGSAGNLFAVTRYKPNGTLDKTFDGDGRVTTRIANDSWANGVAIQSNGRIVAVGGYTTKRFRSGFAVARYLPNGTLDSSFSGDGKALIGSGVNFIEANAVAIQGNGKIVAAGALDFYGFAVARLNPDGTPDSSFGSGGKVSTVPGCGEGTAKSVAVQRNGKIVVAGYTDGPHEAGDHCGPSRFAVVRYRADGTLDPMFSGDGKLTTRFRGGGGAGAVAVDGDGRIVATGSGGTGFALARYHPDGTLDAAFGGDGKVTTRFEGGSAAADGMAIQANGRIVAAGWVEAGPTSFAVARYLAA